MFHEDIVYLFVEDLFTTSGSPDAALAAAKDTPDDPWIHYFFMHDSLNTLAKTAAYKPEDDPDDAKNIALARQFLTKVLEPVVRLAADYAAIHGMDQRAATPILVREALCSTARFSAPPSTPELQENEDGAPVLVFSEQINGANLNALTRFRMAAPPPMTSPERVAEMLKAVQEKIEMIPAEKIPGSGEYMKERIEERLDDAVRRIEAITESGLRLFPEPGKPAFQGGFIGKMLGSAAGFEILNSRRKLVGRMCGELEKVIPELEDLQKIIHETFHNSETIDGQTYGALQSAGRDVAAAQEVLTRITVAQHGMGRFSELANGTIFGLGQNPKDAPENPPRRF